MSTKYTEEQINWLNENSRLYDSYRTLRNDFNKHFGTTKTVPAIQQYLTKILKIQLMTEKKSHIFTSEEEDWIKDNYHKYMMKSLFYLCRMLYKFLQLLHLLMSYTTSLGRNSIRSPLYHPRSPF